MCLFLSLPVILGFDTGSASIRETGTEAHWIQTGFRVHSIHQWPRKCSSVSDLSGLSRKLVSHLSPMQHHAGQVVIRLMHDAHSEIHREVLAICRYKRDFGDSRMINSAMLLVNPHYLFCWDWHLTDTCCIRQMLGRRFSVWQAWGPYRSFMDRGLCQRTGRGFVALETQLFAVRSLGTRYHWHLELRSVQMCPWKSTIIQG